MELEFNREALSKLSATNLKNDALELIKNVTMRQIIAFLLFPIFLMLLMYLPQNLRNSLVFHINSPEVWQFFTHAFIHNDWNHLSGNLGAYFVFGALLLVLANKTNRLKRLFLLFVITLVSLPILSSAFTILAYPVFIPDLKTSQGSSGLVSAMVGFLPIFWISYLSEKQKKDLMNWNFFGLAMLYVALMLGIIYYPIHQSILLILTTVSFLLVFAYFYRRYFGAIFKEIQKEKNIIFSVLLILLPLLFMISPRILFPAKFMTEGGFLDFIIHYFCLIYGISISFIFFKFHESKS